MEGKISKIYLHTQSHFSQTGASKTYLLRILITGNAYLSFLHSKVNRNISHIFMNVNVLIPFGFCLSFLLLMPQHLNCLFLVQYHYLSYPKNMFHVPNLQPKLMPQGHEINNLSKGFQGLHE